MAEQPFTIVLETQMAPGGNHRSEPHLYSTRPRERIAEIRENRLFSYGRGT
jgi:hypothetical protein